MTKSFRCLFAMLAFISLCAAAADLGQTSLIDRDFSIGIGKTVTVEGEDLYIQFKAVLEDSRCPVNALCTMQGNGRVQLEILGAYEQHQTVVLNTDEEPKALNVKGRKLILIALNPPRTADKPILASDYSVTLRVESPLSD